jgi:hypothetical protein
MKRLSVLLASAMFAGLLSAAAAGAAATYNDTLSAFQTATPESDGLAVVIDAAGDLPGMGKVILKREGNNVTGGSWTLTVLPPAADAQASERGRLNGSVGGGTLSFNADGTLSGASSVQLNVEGGTGEHAGVSGGTGTLSLSPNPENASRLTGTLSLNF